MTITKQDKLLEIVEIDKLIVAEIKDYRQKQRALKTTYNQNIWELQRQKRKVRREMYDAPKEEIVRVRCSNCDEEIGYGCHCPEEMWGH